MLLDSLKTAKAQCVVRMVQLSGCRICAADQKRFEQAVADLGELITNLEQGHVQILPTQLAGPGDGEASAEAGG